METATNKLEDLNAALNGAVDAYKAWKESLRQFPVVTSNLTLQRQLENVEEVELPHVLGKLIAGLDLQREFIAMRRYVRNFDDARQVLEALMPLMEERLGDDATIGARSLLDAAINTCQRVNELLKKNADAVS